MFLLNLTNQEIASKKLDLLTMVFVMMMMAVPGHPESCCSLLLLAVALHLSSSGQQMEISMPMKLRSKL